MSSILTNNGAMVALQTLKSINANLGKTQDLISTGKAVATAKDNASVWAISKVMESDVKGFKGISDSLALGESTTATARQAAETVTNLLTDIKSKIVAAQAESADRSKIQTDIKALTDQIKSVTNAAQFGGLNLVKGTDDMKVLSSLDRASDGSVTASQITVGRKDLTTAAGTFGATGLAAASYGTVNGATASDFTSDAGGKLAELTFDVAGITAGDTYQVNINGNTISYTADGTEDANALTAHFAGAINALGLEGISAVDAGTGVVNIANANAFTSVAISLDSTTDANLEMTDINGTGAAPTDPDAATINQRASTIDFSISAGVNEGDSFKVTAGGSSFNYIAGKGETMQDVVKGLKTAIDSNGPDGIKTKVQQDATTKQWKLAIDDANGDGTSTVLSLAVASDGKASGGLFGLDNINVTTLTGATSALDNIETMISTAIDAAASFGSAQGRISTQSDFIGKLTDALKSGIGSMVDADMEEASARLQALQVQQQLGVQSLSIANQAPQSILSLFR